MTKNEILIALSESERSKVGKEDFGASVPGRKYSQAFGPSNPK
jgi:hypothetical protein